MIESETAWKAISEHVAKVIKDLRCAKKQKKPIRGGKKDTISQISPCDLIPYGRPA